jgi:AcrR family transcriptional regulator
MGTPADSQRSRERLIEAAGEVFAENGFRLATVRDICARAGVSPGAVNYHFGSKEGLYEAVLRRAHPASIAQYVASEVAAGATAEERLRNYVRVFVGQILDERRPSWHGRLLIHELGNPTAALDTFVRDIVLPHCVLLEEIIVELLGPAVDRCTVTDHLASVIGQCVFYNHSRPIIERLLAERRYDRQDVERLSRHIADVALAGIAAERRDHAGQR